MITHNGSDVRIMNYGNNSQEWACDRSKTPWKEPFT